MQVLVDGYNLLYALILDLPTGEREDLLKLLEEYRKVTKNNVTVVFDGHKSGTHSDIPDKFAGVKIIYTGSNKTADDKIKELVKNYGAGCVVVSTDNEIINYAKSKQAGYIRSEVFGKRLFNISRKGLNDVDYEEASASKKKGNPKRPKKRERKNLLKLKKI